MAGINAQNVTPPLPGSSSNASSLGLADAASGGAGNIDFDTYLTLLVTQLANQDPLDPLDPNEMTSQLAQYSQIEQQVQTNTLLEGIASANDFSEQSLAVSYIGREALVPSQSIALDGSGSEIDIAFELEGSASNATVQIRNSDGLLVRELNGGTNNGLNFLSFDSAEADGEALPAGEYSVTVSASDFDGRIVEANPYAYVEVTAVQSNDSGINLVLANDSQVDFSQAEIVRSATN